MAASSATKNKNITFFHYLCSETLENYDPEGDYGQFRRETCTVDDTSTDGPGEIPFSLEQLHVSFSVAAGDLRIEASHLSSREKVTTSVHSVKLCRHRSDKGCTINHCAAGKLTSIYEARGREFCQMTRPFAIRAKSHLAYKPRESYYTFHVTLRRNVNARAPLQTHNVLIPGGARRPHSAEFYTQNDVCFIFPGDTSANPYLWAYTAALMAVSPVWRSTFDTAGMQESTQFLDLPEEAREAMQKQLGGILTEARNDKKRSATMDLSDSDDEQGPGASGSASGNRSRAGEPPSPIRYQVIRDTPRTTYKAVLDVLVTGQIRFAHLRSAIKASGGDTKNEGGFASPKSVYRLADHLLLDSLKKVALADFASQLTAGIVLDELFSETCYTHKELQEAALAVAVQHWKTLKDTEKLEAILKRVEECEKGSREAAGIVTKLLRRV